MLRQIKVRLHVLKELWQSGDIWTALRHKIYSYAEAVPVRKDLSKLKPAAPAGEGHDFELVEITASNLERFKQKFTRKSREARVKLHNKKGYHGFVLVKDGQVIGDIWYVTNELARKNIINPSLKKFHIELDDDEAYLFDMFMTPDERGKALTTVFLSKVLAELKDRGYRNAYGFFFMANIPALWVHRVLGYEELPHYSVRKYLAWKIVRPMPESDRKATGHIA